MERDLFPILRLAATGLATFLALASSSLVSSAADPVLRVIQDAPGATNLLRNAGFEASQGTNLTSWSSAPNGYGSTTAAAHTGLQSLVCDAPDETGWRGASQTLALSRTNPAPLIVSGWSKAEAVTGGRDSGYSVYVDIVYQDGTPLWGQTANFSTGTHDWERREVLILPEKPVKSASVYCLFRGHAGRVWFDDVSVVEVAASGEAVLFQGTPMQATTAAQPAPAPTNHYPTADGLVLSVADQRVTGLQIDGRDLATGGIGGFLARDLAAGSDVFAFSGGACPDLGLKLETTFQSHPDHVSVEGKVSDTRGTDRAVLLVFALPMDATGWVWGDDIRRQRAVGGRGEFVNASAVQCGTTGTLSLYPQATLWDARTGVALAIDAAHAAQYRLVYHAGLQQFFIAYDFGLVPEMARSPGAAEFRFVIYRFDAANGFRAGWQKLMDIFPDHYAVRATQQGIWMPFTDVSTVQGWEDFGFRFHEGNNNVPWDDAHGVQSFRYTEPMTWWMSMATNLPRTEAEALKVRDAYAAGPAGGTRTMAEVSRSAAMFDAEGHPALLFRNEPWANGAVWSLNPNPFLPEPTNAATVHWSEPIKQRLYGPGAAGRLDGEYLDSLEGYVTADLNFRRDHFRWSTVPLTFTTDTHRPALFKGLAVYEFTRWLSDDVHRLNGLMFANGVPYRLGFLCPWLDVMGTETDWMSGGNYQPVSDAQLCLWRTLSGRKPYLLLMNTDFNAFTADLVERYFQKSLFYGMFPSMFSHNASENPYWQNPAWYNRDRALFKKYLPLIQEVAEAGWSPVTTAACSNTNILVERFGPATNGSTLFTLRNDTAAVQTGTLRLLARSTNAPALQATELISGTALSWTNGGWNVSLDPGTTAVIRAEPGPRFLRTAITPEGQLQLTVESPLDPEQALETSTDLREWQTAGTHAVTASPFALHVAWSSNQPAQYFRLRW